MAVFSHFLPKMGVKVFFFFLFILFIFIYLFFYIVYDGS